MHLKQLEDKYVKIFEKSGDNKDDTDDPPTRRTDRADKGDRRGNNMKDAMSFKPEILKTTMSASLITDWFENFNLDRFASGWGTGPAYIQKGYLKMVVSEEIRTAATSTI